MRRRRESRASSADADPAGSGLAPASEGSGIVVSVTTDSGCSHGLAVAMVRGWDRPAVHGKRGEANVAATTKDELLAVCETEFDKLEKLLGRVDPDVALARDEEDTSIKDVVAHRAHWISLFLGWYEDGLGGRTVFFPAEGYRWNDLKRYNADIRRQQAGIGWEESRLMLRQAHDQLTSFLMNASEKNLYGGPMKGANNQWTPGRWAEAAGPSHYRSAAKYIRARLRNG